MIRLAVTFDSAYTRSRVPRVFPMPIIPPFTATISHPTSFLSFSELFRGGTRTYRRNGLSRVLTLMEKLSWLVRIIQFLRLIYIRRMNWIPRAVSVRRYKSEACILTIEVAAGFIPDMEYRYGEATLEDGIYFGYVTWMHHVANYHSSHESFDFQC